MENVEKENVEKENVEKRKRKYLYMEVFFFFFRHFPFRRFPFRRFPSTPISRATHKAMDQLRAQILALQLRHVRKSMDSRLVVIARSNSSFVRSHPFGHSLLPVTEVLKIAQRFIFACEQIERIDPRVARMLGVDRPRSARYKIPRLSRTQ